MGIQIEALKHYYYLLITGYRKMKVINLIETFNKN